MRHLLIHGDSPAVHGAGDHDAGTFDRKSTIDGQSKRRFVDQGLLGSSNLMQVIIERLISGRALGAGLEKGGVLQEGIAHQCRNFVATRAEALAVNQIALGQRDGACCDAE